MKLAPSIDPEEAGDGGVYRWDRPGVPRKGWTNVNVEDMGEPSFTCEMCVDRAVRYVHTEVHPDYPEPVRVGCVCAAHMEDDYAAPKEREKKVRKAARHRKNLTARLDKARAVWCEPRQWGTSRRGNYYQTLDDGRRVVVFKVQNGKWRAVIDDEFGRLYHDTPRSAFEATFERLFPLKKLEADLKENGCPTIRLPGERRRRTPAEKRQREEEQAERRREHEKWQREQAARLREHEARQAAEQERIAAEQAERERAWAAEKAERQRARERREREQQAERERQWQELLERCARIQGRPVAILGLTWPFTAAEVKNAYRRLAKQHHPDRGGDPAQFNELVHAYQQALAVAQ
jgi:hypothetical protein